MSELKVIVKSSLRTIALDALAHPAALVPPPPHVAMVDLSNSDSSEPDDDIPAARAPPRANLDEDDNERDVNEDDVNYDNDSVIDTLDAILDAVDAGDVVCATPARCLRQLLDLLSFF